MGLYEHSCPQPNQKVEFVLHILLHTFSANMDKGLLGIILPGIRDKLKACLNSSAKSDKFTKWDSSGKGLKAKQEDLYQ